MAELNMGKILIAKRREKGITQEKVAQYFGVSKASISKWETGQSFPDILLLPKIATYYGISMDALFDHAPQLNVEEIREIYEQYGERYQIEPFEVWSKDIEQVIQKYYTCDLFLLAMAQWFLNYGLIHPDLKQKEYMQHQTKDLASRIIEHSNDAHLLNMANMMLANLFNFQKDYESCFEILGKEAKVATDMMWNDLLAQVYATLGDKEKAVQINQINIYQNIFGFLNSLVAYQALHVEDKEQHDRLYKQIKDLIASFHLEKNCSNSIFTTHLIAAQSSILNQNYEEAIHNLEAYCMVVKSVCFPILLNRNDYFHLIDEWVEDKVQTGSFVPMIESQTKDNFINALKDNQEFSVLSDREDYQQMLQELEKYLKEENNYVNN